MSLQDILYENGVSFISAQEIEKFICDKIDLFLNEKIKNKFEFSSSTYADLELLEKRVYHLEKKELSENDKQPHPSLCSLCDGKGWILPPMAPHCKCPACKCSG